MKKWSAILLILVLFTAGVCLAEGECKSLKSLDCTPAYKGVDFSFTAQGHDMLFINYKSSQESGQFLLKGQDGFFSGHIDMPGTYDGSNVFITVTTMKNLVLIEKYNTKTAVPEPAPGPQQPGRLSGITVCIDPGHSANCPTGTEPLGPGLSGTKRQVTSMAQGTLTRRMESVVNLEIAFVLRDVLLSQGADVVMTRTTEEASLNNLNRCDIAEAGGADIMLRLHCNLVDNKNTTGIQIYSPKDSSYAKQLGSKEDWKRWNEMMLTAMQASTGNAKGGTKMTNDYTGNNWAKMPCFLIEMGYMSNYGEDILLSEPWYQLLLSEGMADGVYAICADRGLLK
ncbi:MAG: hypothetical protein CW338_06890 [Clostridiales bacterium]|nr:hypothetical protein [Clostridiales bacterium]